MKTALVLVLLALAAVCSARIVEFRYPSENKEVTEERSSEEDYSELSREDTQESSSTQRERTLRASVYVPRYGFKKARKRKYDEDDEFKYRKSVYYQDDGRGKYLTRKKTSRNYLLKDPFLKSTKYEPEIGDRRKDYRSAKSYGPMYQPPPPPPPPPAPYSKPAPPKSSCGHSVLIGCTPTVTRVPCGFATGGYGSYSEPLGPTMHGGPAYPDVAPPLPSPPSYHHSPPPSYHPPPPPPPTPLYYGPQNYHQPAPHDYQPPSPSYPKDSSYPSPGPSSYANLAPHAHQPSSNSYPQEKQPSHAPPSSYDQPSPHSDYQPPPPSSGYQPAPKPPGPPAVDYNQPKPQQHHSQAGNQYSEANPFHQQAKPSHSYQPAPPAQHHRPQHSYQPYQPTYRSSDHASQFNTPSFAQPVKEDTQEPAQVQPHISAFPTTTSSSTPAVPTVPADRDQNFRLADNPIVPAEEGGSLKETSGDGPTHSPPANEQGTLTTAAPPSHGDE